MEVPVVSGGVQSILRREVRVLSVHRKEEVGFNCSVTVEQTVPCFLVQIFTVHRQTRQAPPLSLIRRRRSSEIDHLESMVTRRLSTVDMDCWYFLVWKSPPLFESDVHFVRIDHQSILAQISCLVGKLCDFAWGKVCLCFLCAEIANFSGTKT